MFGIAVHLIIVLPAAKLCYNLQSVNDGKYIISYFIVLSDFNSFTFLEEVHSKDSLLLVNFLGWFFGSEVSGVGDGGMLAAIEIQNVITTKSSSPDSL